MSGRADTVVAPPAAAGALPLGLAGLLGEFWLRAPLGLCLTDAQGTVVAANPAFCATVGWTAEELTGASAMGLIAAEASVQGSLAHTAFIGGDDGAMAGTVYLHKSGRPLLAQVTDTRVRSPDGRAFRLTSLADLSGQVESVRVLREHQQAANFSALASDISNDFNNLLSIILGYTAFLQDPALDAARLSTAIGGIEHAVRRASNLIRQTLHLSRRDEMAFQRMAPGDFVREFYRMTGETLTAGIDLVFEIEEGLPPVLLDPQHFHHALANLGQKARELVGEGGRVTVGARRVSGGEVRAKFPDAREAAYVAVSLRAEPPASGLEREAAPDVWSAAVEFVGRRRDLAVLVVHTIMAGHRGYLEVDARSGAALVFRLYLPASAEEAAKAAPVPPSSAPAMPDGGRTVLLVDDEETLLQTLTVLLERNGCRVIVARDGQEAVELFQARAPEIALVLIDLGLPRMSGWEAFQKIKERSPAARIAVMSGHLEANLRAKVIQGGACGYLQKPFSMAEALAEVRRAWAAPA